MRLETKLDGMVHSVNFEDDIYLNGKRLEVLGSWDLAYSR